MARSSPRAVRPDSSMAARACVDLIVESVYRADGWFVDEVPLVLAALVMGALGVQALSSARRP